MPHLAVKWLQKKIKKSEAMFYNTEGKCCANTQVKNFVKSKNDTPTTGQAATDFENKFANGLSLVHVYFKELEIVKYSKQENYGMMDLIGK